MIIYQIKIEEAEGLLHACISSLISSQLTHSLNFSDQNSYSTEISSQNELFNMYIVEKKVTKRLLIQNSRPKCFKTTTFDRFRRKAGGVRRFNTVLNLKCFHLRSCYLVPHWYHAHIPVNFMVYFSSGCQKFLALYNGIAF